MKNIKTTVALSIALALAANAAEVMADSKGKGKGSDDRGGGSSACRRLATALDTDVEGLHAALKAELDAAVATEQSGLDLHMWATLVNRDGVVCAVAFSGANRNSQWPGSRVISAQKANTANAFSLDTLALSTANLYAAVQPGGSLYGLQESNPVDTEVAYKGPTSNFGRKNDPMVGERVGGVNVFGGGLPLYNASHKIIGAVGLSGDTSCADHNIAWRVRAGLGLDNLEGVGGVSGDDTRADNIVFDIVDGVSASGFGHPVCIKSDNVSPVGDNAGSTAYVGTLPTTDH
ncbi:MAG: heme-binding protein [Gammaproteobacteria bacterium]|jgi:uncharacterized protein GlcG (DUF336 family)|nr:heme-binding protein [Gammaproteobacteria bacterium]